MADDAYGGFRDTRGLRALSGHLTIRDRTIQKERVESLREAFEEEGYAALTAGHGQEALELITNASSRPDVVVLDVVLPTTDGGRLYQVMRADPELQNIPVVVSTSSTARAPSGVIVVPKPLELDRLLDTVADVFKEEASSMRRRLCRVQKAPVLTHSAPATG